MSGVDDILRYLRHTRTLGLTFTKGDINLYATADAAFDVLYPDSKSHSGGTIHLGATSASFLPEYYSKTTNISRFIDRS